jgi:hypothetical protein
MINKSIVRFVNNKAKDKFYNLEKGDFSEKQLFKFLIKATDDLKRNAFCGIHMAHNFIPKEYKKFGIDNLWKYDLPNGWRLIYTITSPDKIELITVIIEWFDHKNYEKRFNYMI